MKLGRDRTYVCGGGSWQTHSYFKYIWVYRGSSASASRRYRPHRAINNNDNRLHLIEVFRKAVLWIMAHFLCHLNRWPTSIQLLASFPVRLLRSPQSILIFASYWFPPWGWGAYQTASRSILVATEKIEDTDNLAGHATDVVSSNCVPRHWLEPPPGERVFVRVGVQGEEKKTK